MPSIDLKAYKKKKKPIPSKPDSERLLTFLNKDISFGKAELSDRKKEHLFLELSSLLQAGINLKSSMELLVADKKKETDLVYLSQIQESVIQGSAFSKAIENSGKFSLYEVHSIQIGEETGKLTEVFQDLSKFYKNKVKQRRTIITALTYPCVVMTTSLGAVFFMLKFVVPVFAEIFKRSGGKLPWLTQKIIKISDVLETNFYGIVFLLLLLTIVTFTIRKTEKFRKISSLLLLKLPFIGSLIQKIYLARFCNCMRLLINAHLPLLRAISLSRKMIGYYPIEASLQKIEDDIMKGKSLHQSLQKFEIYPSKLIQLLKLGEETNQLDYFFAKISDQYIEEVDYKTSMLSSAMQPLIIIFLGVVVGAILIAMYLPLFQMSNSFQ